jgi:hypothetical protein
MKEERRKRKEERGKRNTLLQARENGLFALNFYL